jgi:hypothetical protein
LEIEKYKEPGHKCHFVTLSEAKSLATVWKSEILRCAQNDEQGRFGILATGSKLIFYYAWPPACDNFTISNLQFPICIGCGLWPR